MYMKAAMQQFSTFHKNFTNTLSTSASAKQQRGVIKQHNNNFFFIDNTARSFIYCTVTS